MDLTEASHLGSTTVGSSDYASIATVTTTSVESLVQQNQMLLLANQHLNAEVRAVKDAKVALQATHEEELQQQQASHHQSNAASGARFTSLSVAFTECKQELETCRAEIAASEGKIRALTTELDQIRQDGRDWKSEMLDWRRAADERIKVLERLGKKASEKLKEYERSPTRLHASTRTDNRSERPETAAGRVSEPCDVPRLLRPSTSQPQLFAPRLAGLPFPYAPSLYHSGPVFVPPVHPQASPSALRSPPKSFHPMQPTAIGSFAGEIVLPPPRTFHSVADVAASPAPRPSATSSSPSRRRLSSTTDFPAPSAGPSRPVEASPKRKGKETEIGESTLMPSEKKLKREDEEADLLLGLSGNV